MEWMHGGGRDPNGRGLDEEIRIGKEDWMERQRVAQGGRIGLQSGQLVQPGPGRQGYAKKSRFDVLGREYGAKPLTKNQVAAMEKNKPDGISLVPDPKVKGQWNYRFSLEKGERGTKNHVTKYATLRATPENLEKLIEMREAAVKEIFPGRLTNREFKRLRFLPDNLKLTNQAFADVLHDLEYKKIKGEGRIEGSTVEKRQKVLGISDDVGARAARLPRNKSEVFKLIRESSGGKELLQIYNWDKHEKMLRRHANALVSQENVAKSKGYFPKGLTNEGKLWSSFKRAADQGDRIKIVGEFADGKLPLDADGYVDWWKKDKNGVHAWKRVEFVDTEAPGKQNFTWNVEKNEKGTLKYKGGNLKTQVDKAFGSGYFTRNTKGYDLAVLDSQRMFKGEKIGTLVRDKMLMKELKANIFKSEGIRRQPTKLEIDEFMARKKPGWAMTEGHHVEGVAKNPYKVEPAFRVANQKLGNLTTKYKARKIDKATFIDEIRKLPGGIRYKVDDILEGTKTSEVSRVKAAVKASGFNKNTANKIFKSYQAQGIGTKCQWKAAAAEGGRIGFAAGGYDDCMKNAIQKHNKDLQSTDISVKNAARAKQYGVLKSANKMKGVKNLLQMGRKGFQAIVGGAGSVIGGPWGVALEAALEGMFYEHYRRKGYNDKQAQAETFFYKMTKPDRETGVWEDAEKLLKDELVGKRDEAGYLKSAQPHRESWFDVGADKYQTQLAAREAELATNEKLTFELGIMKNQWQPGSEEAIAAKEQEINDSYDRLDELEITLKQGTPEQEAYVRAEEKQKALQDKRADKRAEEYGRSPDYSGNKQRQWQKEFLDYRKAKPKHGQFFTSERDPDWKERNPYAYKDAKVEANIGPTKEELAKGMNINWKEVFPRAINTPRTTEQQKWDFILNQGGWDLMDKISAAGGVANMAEGGIASLKKK
jgi:hypothetical protein